MAELPTRAGPTGLTTSAAALKTAAGASTYVIVRSILICNTHNAVVKVTLGIDQATSDTALEHIAHLYPLNPGQTEELISPGNFLVLAGHASTPDRIYGYADVTGVVTVTISSWEGP